MIALTQTDKAWLLRQAREAIARHLQGMPPLDSLPPSDVLRTLSGVFVTLHIGGNLRGCIGMPLPRQPVYEAVRENAIAAAFEDPRFPPLRDSELSRIHIEISVMTAPREVSGPDDVEVGRDGIIITRGTRRGLLLPQVPVEQGWSRDQFLSYGCLKAGLPPDAWREGVEIETFQAMVFGEEPPKASEK
ncbi:MAG: AmmeMemoRadiSam system protein A [Candidatus Aminicenantes bacterium]|nr:AmmeMemoRadiSam system protein A [Candidatus Aminicenantes bacterium]